MSNPGTVRPPVLSDDTHRGRAGAALAGLVEVIRGANAQRTADSADRLGLAEYQSLVNQVISSADDPTAPGPRVFDNFGEGHARIVLEAMLRRAQRQISVYSQRLSTEVHQGQLLRAFLTRAPEGRIRILVEEPTVFDNPASALFGMRDLLGPRFEVARTAHRSRHISIVDDLYVRSEDDHDLRKATVGFGDRSFVRSALNLFDTLWTLRVPL